MSKNSGLSDHVGANIGTLIVATSVKLKKKIRTIDITIEREPRAISVRSLVIWGAENTRALLVFLFARQNIGTETRPKISTNKEEQPDH